MKRINILHLTDLKLGFFNGYPGSMKEYELDEINDLVKEFIINPRDFLNTDNYDNAVDKYSLFMNVLTMIILEEYGEEKILLLIENLWKHDNFKDCFEEVIGKKYREFDDEWLYSLKKKYYPHLAKDDFSSKISETIIREGYNFKPAYYKNNGENHIVYVANKTGYSSIYRSPLIPLKILQKDNSQILIKGGKTSDFETFHLFSSKIDVNKNGILAFVSKSGENDALYLYDINEKIIKAKYYFKELVGISSPSWSPDSNKIVFSGLSFFGYNDLYIFDIKSEDLRKVTNDFYDDNDPSWSPDGNLIVFSSDRTTYGKQNSKNLFLLDISSGNILSLTYGKHKDLAPVFSPDGKYIAYTSDRNLKINIYITELNEKYEPILSYKATNFANGAFDPEWTPDGGLLFGVYEYQRFQIRYLEKIIDYKETAKIYQISGIRRGTKPWEFENLKIKFQIEKIVGILFDLSYTGLSVSS